MSILTRSYADDLLEALRQMALTAEPRISRHRRQWFAGLDELLGMADPHAFLVGVWRHPDFGVKSTQQIVGAEGYMPGEFVQRTKNIYDLSLPSGNSVASAVMLRLYHITGEKKYLDTAIKVMESLGMMAAENPFGFGQLLNAVYAYLIKPLEITVINSSNMEIKNYLTKKFIPEAILVLISAKEELEDLKQLQFFAGKEYDDNKTRVYVCRDFACSLPLETISDIEKLV